MTIQNYIIDEGETYLYALKKIDFNRKGFLIVVDSQKKAIGVITDGDIRRAFLSGIKINDKIVIDKTKCFHYLSPSNSFSDTIDIFKNEAINFLPILDKDMRVKNIITKKQMHTILLKDQNVDLEYDFMSIDETLMEYEIFSRPWGFYRTTVMNDYFQSKIIIVRPEESLSLQSHEHREEHWIIAHGEGKVQLENSILSAHVGNIIFIPKGCKHRLTNTGKKDNLIIVEVQIGDYFGEDDIKRYDDNYGRK